jgi:hypothetical protein
MNAPVPVNVKYLYRKTPSSRFYSCTGILYFVLELGARSMEVSRGQPMANAFTLAHHTGHTPAENRSFFSSYWLYHGMSGNVPG